MESPFILGVLFVLGVCFATWITIPRNQTKEENIPLSMNKPNLTDTIEMPVIDPRVLPYIDSTFKQAHQYSRDRAKTRVGEDFEYILSDLPPLNICSTHDFKQLIASQAAAHGLKHKSTVDSTMKFTRLE